MSYERMLQIPEMHAGTIRHMAGPLNDIALSFTSPKTQDTKKGATEAAPENVIADELSDILGVLINAVCNLQRLDQFALEGHQLVQAEGAIAFCRFQLDAVAEHFVD